MLLCAERPGKFVDNFSKEFKSTFLQLLRQRYATKRVQATIVYNEYISGVHITAAINSELQIKTTCT